MSEHSKLIAADGGNLGGCRAAAKGAPKSGLVVGREIFGGDRHIRAMGERIAEAG